MSTEHAVREVPARLREVRLGPVQLDGLRVVLRPPSYADHAAWQALRLRDRARIEPVWTSSSLTWSRRHAERAWVREVQDSRDPARRGVGVSWVVEVDGRFAGQVQLSDVDLSRGHAEIGAWVDATLARRGVGGIATCLVLDDAFTRLRLNRVVAPVAVANVGTQRACESIGMRQEAVMSAYLDVGGRRQDHVLYAVLAEDVPQDGFVPHLFAHRGATDRTGPYDVVGRPRARALPTSWPARAEVVRGAVRGRRHRAGSDGVVAWRLRDETQDLGVAGLRRLRPSLGIAEVWWQVRCSDLEDRAAAALAPLIDRARRQHELRRLEAVVEVGRSDRVLRELGFVREGGLRGYVDDERRRGDVELWSLTRVGT